MSALSSSLPAVAHDHGVVVQRVTSALNAAASLDQVSAVVSGEVAGALGATRSALVVGDELIELRGVTTPDEPAAIAGALQQLPARWWAAAGELPAELAWFGGATVGVVPLVAAERRVGTLVVGIEAPAIDEARASLAGALAAPLAAAAARARAHTELLRACAARDQFLGVLGHELRNPLAPILTATQLMQLRSPDGLVKERTTIERNVASLIRIADELLDVSRIARGQVEVTRTPTELSAVVTQALEAVGPRFEERGHRVTVAVPQGLVVDGDRVRLVQVVTILLANAARFTPDGGAIEIAAERDADTIAVVVSDTGSGISSELLPRIFDPFGPGVDRKGTLGVSLAIARALVASHGGTLVAASEGPGRGARFMMTLPGRPVERSSVESTTTARPGQLRILIVDDNEDAAWLLAEALRMLHHDVRVCHDGLSALETARAWAPQIGFLDIGLPGMDGYTLCRHLLELPARPHAIAVTGYGQPGDRERVMAAGFAAHFVKPVSLRDVQAAIDAFVARN